MKVQWQVTNAMLAWTQAATGDEEIRSIGLARHVHMSRRLGEVLAGTAEVERTDLVEFGLAMFALLGAIPLVVKNPYAMGLLTLLAIYGILLIGLDVTVGYLPQDGVIASDETKSPRN